MARFAAIVHALVAASLAAAPAIAKPREPIPLPLQGKWEINYDVDACHLIASFGPEKERLIARFSRFSPGDWFYLDLFGKPLRSTELQQNVKVGFGPDENFRQVTAIAGKAGALAMLKFGVLDLLDRAGDAQDIAVAVTPEQERAVRTLTVTLGSKVWRLELGPMDGPMRALRTCNDDLIKYWGYDPVQQASLGRRPEPVTVPGTWLDSADYPQTALVRGASGVVQFRLDVQADGSVGGCHVQARTNPDEFADRSCRLLTKRARFRPALDHAGIPVRSYFVSRIYWMMAQ